MTCRVRPICRYVSASADISVSADVSVSADKGNCHIGTLSVSADKIPHIGRFADRANLSPLFLSTFKSSYWEAFSKLFEHFFAKFSNILKKILNFQNKITGRAIFRRLN